jgi:hypothetical protein
MKIKKNGKVVTLTEGDIRRILKRVISEQEEGNTQSTNVTLTDIFNGLSTEPKVLESNNGSETISFPPASDGMPVEGNRGVKNKKSIILPIGGNAYLVIGSIGTLDSNMKVSGEEPGALVIIANKFTGDGAGGPVRNIPQNKLLQVRSLPLLVSNISKKMNERKPVDWYLKNKDMLLKALKMSSGYGIDTSMLDDVAKFETEVKRKLQA